tara:strand:+ start:143 stop:1144 length:1002 start_codon:yes stop_codon:yes gene_type:complete
LKKYNQILDIILPAIIGLELIILVLGNHSPKSIFTEIKQILIDPSNWLWIFLSMLIGYLGEALRGIRWKLLINPLGYNVKTIDLINACAAGYMFNAGVPRSGEIARCTLLSKVSNTPISYLFGHVLIERAIDVIILIICIISCLIYKWTDVQVLITNNNYLAWIFSTNTFFVLIMLFFVFFFSYKWTKKIIPMNTIQWIKKHLLQIKTGVFSVFSVKQPKLFILYTFLIWLCYLLMTFVCFLCFKSMQDFNLLDGLLIMTIGGIGMAIPTPGGMGSYHGAVYIGLCTFLGQEGDVATTFGFLVHSAQTIMIVSMGFVGLFFLNLKKPYNAKMQ